MTRHLRIALAVVLAGVGLMVANAPAAHASSCPASATIAQAPPSLLAANPTVTFEGSGTCDTPHQLDGYVALYLDGVKVDDSNFAWSGFSTSAGSGPVTYTPMVCPWPFTSFSSTTHTWEVDTTFYHGVWDGNFVVWDTPTYATATLTFTCPHVL